MEEGRGASANVLLDHGLFISNWAERQLRLNQIANCWPAHHVAHAAYRARERSQILRLGKVFRKDARMCRRILAAQQDAAAAKGTAGADHNREAMSLGEKIGETPPDPTAGDQRGRHDDDRVGDRERRIAAHVPSGRDIAFAQRATARYRVPQSDPERRPRVHVFVSGHRPRARKAQRVGWVVLKIAPDLRRTNQHWNIEAREVIGWPDTRHHQELGRVDGAPAQDDLALRPDRLAYPIPDDLDPARSTAFDYDACGDRLRQQFEIPAPPGRLYISNRS